MIELALTNIQKYYGANMVLKDITFDIQTGERVGIIGRNGSGKSTLFKIIMGIEGYDSGSLSIRKGSTLGYLEQMPKYDDGLRVIDVLNSAFEKTNAIHDKMKELESLLSQSQSYDADRLLNRYSELQTQYESLGGYEKEEKLSKVCTGLKMGCDFTGRYFSCLSGGEKTTVILGRILLQNPDILLLDEPSNHLDLESMEWLEEYLKDYKGTVIIISHDRYFLDNVVKKVIEIEDMVSKTYIGNYTGYVKEKNIQLTLQLEAYLDQQKKIKSTERAISQLRDWGARGDNNKFFKRAASMQAMLDRMDKIEKPVLERGTISIGTNTAERSGNDVVVIKDLYKSFGEKVLIKGSNLHIRKSESVGLIGPNGCGKTTLVKILLGSIPADSGFAVLGSSIKLGYLPQNISFNDENKTVLECFRDGISITEGKARQYLAKYMFTGEYVFKKVCSLSGGERSRLMLSMIMYNEINFLILDEPTNHLDIDSREELENFLSSFDGTLLFISHDRYFINSMSSRVVELSDGVFVSYEGNYEYYKEKKSSRKAVQAGKVDGSNTSSCKYTGIPAVKDNKYKLKIDIEAEIEKLEERLKTIESEISRECGSYERVKKLYDEKTELHETIELLMDKFFSL